MSGQANASGTTAQTGYLHRRAPLDEQGLRDLLRDVFGDAQVYAFGASILELLPLKPYPAVNDVLLRGEQSRLDNGHIFSPRAEVRWKRTGDSYDALVLTEDAALIAALAGAGITTEDRFEARPAPKRAWMLLATPRDVQQREGRWRLGYVEYRGTNGAVQFVRYTERKERTA